MRNTKHLISALISVRDGEVFVREAIESLLRQTYSNFEVVVVDDGSVDSTAQIVARLAEQDSRVRLHRTEKIGIPAALNRGLEIAKGDLIAKMDADDLALPERFARQAEEFENYPDLVLLGAEVELVTTAGISLGLRGHLREHTQIREKLLQGNGGALTHPVVMFRRASVEAIGGYDERFKTNQDLDLFLRLSEIGKVKNLEEVLLKWRQHPESVNRTKSHTWKELRKLAISKTIERIGVEQYLDELFKCETKFGFPSRNLDLGNFALRNNRRESARSLFRKALEDPETKWSAKEELAELRIIELWWKFRGLGRRLVKLLGKK